MGGKEGTPPRRVKIEEKYESGKTPEQRVKRLPRIASLSSSYKIESGQRHGYGRGGPGQYITYGNRAHERGETASADSRLFSFSSVFHFQADASMRKVQCERLPRTAFRCIRNMSSEIIRGHNAASLLGCGG